MGGRRGGVLTVSLLPTPTRAQTKLRWWLTPLILVFQKQKQVDPCEFEASLVNRKVQESQDFTETLSQKEEQISECLVNYNHLWDIKPGQLW